MRNLHPRLRDGPQPREPEAWGCLLLPGASAVGQVGRVLRPGSCSVCYIFSVWSCFVLPQKAKFFPFFPAFLEAGLMWQNSLSQIFCFPTITGPFGGNGESQKLPSGTKWFSVLLLVTLHPSAISEDQCRVGEGGGQAPLVTPRSPMWPVRAIPGPLSHSLSTAGHTQWKETPKCKASAILWALSPICYPSGPNPNSSTVPTVARKDVIWSGIKGKGPCLPLGKNSSATLQQPGIILCGDSNPLGKKFVCNSH